MRTRSVCRVRYLEGQVAHDEAPFFHVRPLPTQLPGPQSGTQGLALEPIRSVQLAHGSARVLHRPARSTPHPTPQQTPPAEAAMNAGSCCATSRAAQPSLDTMDMRHVGRLNKTISYNSQADVCKTADMYVHQQCGWRQALLLMHDKHVTSGDVHNHNTSNVFVVVGKLKITTTTTKTGTKTMSETATATTGVSTTVACIYNHHCSKPACPRGAAAQYVGCYLYVTSRRSPAGHPSASTFPLDSSSSGAGCCAHSTGAALRASTSATFRGTPPSGPCSGPAPCSSRATPPTTTCRLGLRRSRDMDEAVGEVPDCWDGGRHGAIHYIQSFLVLEYVQSDLTMNSLSVQHPPY